MGVGYPLGKPPVEQATHPLRSIRPASWPPRPRSNNLPSLLHALARTTPSSLALQLVHAPQLLDRRGPHEGATPVPARRSVGATAAPAAPVPARRPLLSRPRLSLCLDRELPGGRSAGQTCRPAADHLAMLQLLRPLAWPAFCARHTHITHVHTFNPNRTLRAYGRTFIPAPSSEAKMRFFTGQHMGWGGCRWSRVAAWQ